MVRKSRERRSAADDSSSHSAQSEDDEDEDDTDDDLSYDANDDDIEIPSLRRLSSQHGVPTEYLYRMWNHQEGVCFLSGIPLVEDECSYSPCLVPYVVEKPLSRKNFRFVCKVFADVRPAHMRWSQLIHLCKIVSNHQNTDYR